MTVEVFKPVVFRGKKVDGYEISNKGRVKSLERKIEYWTTNQTGKPFKYVRHTKEKYLTSRLDRYGYQVVAICIDYKVYYAKIHRLVCEAFIPNPNNYRNVNHKDENKTNNCVSNLEWCTTEYNNKYGSRGEQYKSIKVYNGDELVYNFSSLREASRELGLDRKIIMKFVNNEPQVFRKGGKNTQYQHLIFKLC